jgi:cyclopropane fatty-acyl-phospholipid synthase-like methyltransferase
MKISSNLNHHFHYGNQDSEKDMEDNLTVVRETYNAIADVYNDAISSYEAEYLSLFFSKANITTAASIIDLGCGQGRMALYYHERIGAKVLGCDISERMLGIAKSRNIYPKDLSFVLSDMQDIKTYLIFDAAVASFSFIHLTSEQVKKTLANIRECLKDDAMIYISILVGDNCGFVKEPLNESFDTFVHQYTQDTITNILISEFFSVVDVFWGKDDSEAALSREAMFLFARKEKR